MMTNMNDMNDMNDINDTHNPLNGQFQPGHAKVPGSGRKPGTPNKYSGQVKDELTKAVIDLMPEMVDRMRAAPANRELGDMSFMNRFFQLLTAVMPHDGERILPFPPVLTEQDEILLNPWQMTE